MSAELKPCPFCGGTPLIQEHEAHSHSDALKALIPGIPNHPGSWTIECCDVGMIKDTRTAVVEAWNRRAEPSSNENSAALAAPSQPAEPNTSTSNTMAGFRGGFIALHGRAPTEQEIWNAGVDSGRRRFGASHPAAEQAASEGEREVFEAWWRDEGKYHSKPKENCFRAWQASAARRPVRELSDDEILAVFKETRGDYHADYMVKVARALLARATGEEGK